MSLIHVDNVDNLHMYDRITVWNLRKTWVLSLGQLKMKSFKLNNMDSGHLSCLQVPSAYPSKPRMTRTPLLAPFSSCTTGTRLDFRNYTRGVISEFKTVISSETSCQILTLSVIIGYLNSPKGVSTMTCR